MVEFYVISAFVAAAVIAYFCRPADRGPARQILLAGELSLTGHPEPAIELEALDDGSVLLRRYGLRDINETGAVSLAVKVVGFDVRIEERLALGRDPLAPPIDTATFRLDFMGREHYNIFYNSDPAGLFAATTLHNRPGIRLLKPLQ